MPDRWTLKTPSGDYELNASFAARQYHPGGVDTSAALRRDDRTAYQRSGDGLRTPGPLILYGRVWRDDMNVPAIVDELNDIRDAIAATTDVVRTTAAGTYTYSGLSGGPRPEVTPDGLGGWQVVIELWPARAAAAFLPTAGEVMLMATVAGVDSFQSGSNPHSIALPITTQASDLIIAAFQGDGTITAATGWENLSGAAGFDPLRTLSTSKLWGLKRVASGAETSIDFTATSFFSYYAAAVLRGEGLDVSGVNHAMYQNVDAGDPNSVTGSSPGTGTQLLFGLAEVFGLN